MKKYINKNSQKKAKGRNKSGKEQETVSGTHRSGTGEGKSQGKGLEKHRSGTGAGKSQGKGLEKHRSGTGAGKSQEKGLDKFRSETGSGKSQGKRLEKYRSRTEISKSDSSNKFEAKPGKNSGNYKASLKKGEFAGKRKAGISSKAGNKAETEIRLNRFIANAGVCSRREADEFIVRGMVKINGKVVTELGTKVGRRDEVRFKDKKLIPEKKTYILLNKPRNVITTTEDPQGRKTVLSLIKRGPEERIYPVGRLDRMSTGVLLLTNDGELTKKLTHPKYKKKKIYQVSLAKDLTNTDMKKIAEGIELEDGFIQADIVSYIDENDKREIGIEIHSGKNRILRRMFEHLDYEVIRLDRVYFAGLTKKGLPRGRWRFLTDKEISILKRGSYE